MAYINRFVKSQVDVSNGDQLTVGLKGVLMSGVVLEGNSTAVIKGIVLNQRGSDAVATKNGENWDIAIESAAFIMGGQRGLFLQGSGGTVSNAGRVFADGTAVHIEGRNHNFNNSGSVEGFTGVYIIPDGGSMVNDVGGTITGEQVGIISTGLITNFGTITGGIAARLFGSESGLVNKGEIFGNILVHGQKTVLDMRGGEMNGVIRSEAGLTTVITDVSDLRFVASGGEASVRASVDYSLGNGVSKLVLTGTAAISGKGNNEGNTLVGNDGNNALRGMQGYDTLDGGKGDDTLTGGANQDIFIFERGDGHDVITDFRVSSAGDERDRIELGNLTSWQDRETFMDDHVRNDGQGNVIIEFDDQSITLAGLRKSDLSREDFNF